MKKCKFKIGDYVLITGKSHHSDGYVKPKKNKIFRIKHIGTIGTDRFPFLLDGGFSVHISEIRRPTNQELILAKLRGQLK